MRSYFKYTLLLLLGFLGFKSLPAHAAVDIFLCFEGVEDLKGETQDKARRDCSDVISWSWGASNSVTLGDGGGGGAGRVNFQDISITKKVNSASVGLMRRVKSGDFIPSFDLYVRRAGACDAGCPDGYFRLKGSNGVWVTSISTGASDGEDVVTENISLLFERIEYCYAKQRVDGSYETETCSRWDARLNETF